MNLNDVQEQVVAIQNMQHDHEAAHSNEDALYLSILKALFHDEIPQEQIKAVLEEAIATQHLNFQRDCA